MKAKSFLSVSDFAIVGLFAIGVAAIEGIASSSGPACRSCEFEAVRRAVVEQQPGNVGQNVFQPSSSDVSGRDLK